MSMYGPDGAGAPEAPRAISATAAAAQNVRRLISLSLVPRGEGRGEGLFDFEI
jgi:hypothetical protein